MVPRRAHLLLALLALALLALAFVGQASASTLLPDPTKLELTTLDKPGLASWVQPCGPKLQHYQIDVRSIAGKFSAAKPVTGCGNYLMSQPAMSYTSYHNRSYLVWSQSPQIPFPGAKPRGIFLSFSEDNGADWSKPRLVFPLTHYLPPPIKIAAYVQWVWVMWADSFSVNPTKDEPFHIAAVNAFSWAHNRSVSGVSKFSVFPDSGDMVLQASKDGVAAFWLTFNVRKPEDSFWYFADTQRVTPPKQGVTFIYRGKVGDMNNVNMFTGLDGRLYRFASDIIGLQQGSPYVGYAIDRWAFRKHKFVPLFTQPAGWPTGVPVPPTAPNPFFTLPASSLTPLRGDVAEMVDAQHNLHMVYIDPGVDATTYQQAFPVCQLGLSFTCTVAQEAQGFAKSPLVSATYSYPTGKLSEKTALPLPVASAPSHDGSWGEYVQPLQTYGGTTFVSTPMAMYLFSRAYLVPVASKPNDYYYVDPRNALTERFYTLSGVIR